MIRTQVSLDEKMYREAKSEAERRGISFAELVRRALARSLEAREQDKPWMRYAGISQSGDPHASRSVDETVYARERP